jgi:WD40 repeat protein
MMLDDHMTVTEIKHFHSGKISDLCVNPNQNAAVTLGQDGQAKLWDFIKDREFYSRKFLGRGTCLDMLPYSEANLGKVVAAGFDNGIVRILMLGSHDF